MYDPEMRKDCPMRGNLGNCSPVGGFCMDAVSDEICEAVHNAYDHGFHDAVRKLRKLKEQEPVEPIPPTDESDLWRCGNCNHQLFRCTHQRYCEMCGRSVKWE